MSTFTDALGQEWRLEFDCFLLDRIATEAKVDLADISGGGLLAIQRDVKALGRVLVVACEEQLKERRRPAADFQKQIRKEAITRARGALLEALADFFPQSEWSEMQSNSTKRKEQPEMTPDQLQLATAFLRMDPEVQREVLGMIREEGLGNLQSSQAEGFASDLDVIQSMPADTMPESAESAPEDTPSETSG